MGIILSLAFLGFIAINVPIAFSMGLASIFGLLLKGNIPLVIVPQKIFTGCDSFPLLAVPFFILAGALMDTGGISLRLVNLAQCPGRSFQKRIGHGVHRFGNLLFGHLGFDRCRYSGHRLHYDPGDDTGRLHSGPGDRDRLRGLRYGDIGSSLHCHGRLRRSGKRLDRGSLCGRVPSRLCHGNCSDDSAQHSSP